MSSRIRRIFLVRHGESMGNVDKNIHRTHADHAIPLSEEGRTQAMMAGKFLGNFLREASDIAGYPQQARLWVSPYLRARQTADEIEEEIGDEPVRGLSQIESRRESLALCEQQFGLFDGISNDELEVRFPAEHAHYAKQEEFEGRFWARMPMGESRWDVAMRVHQVFGTWHRDAERHDIQNLIVVTHGVTIRCIVMRWLHLPVEWIEKEPNPKNCSIRLISLYRDREYRDEGYIYEGG